MTVTDMTARMSAREMAEWRAFDTIDPIGDERADLRTGILAALLGNINRRKGSKAFKPSDFMPFIDRAAKADKQDTGTAIRGFFGPLAARNKKG